MAAQNEMSLDSKLRQLGREPGAEPTRVPVSLMGHIMPKIYVLMAEVFPLPQDANPEAIIKSMTTGLDAALAQCPPLTGTLELDAASGQMWVKTQKPSDVPLYVKHLVDKDFPSFAELDAKDFPPSLIDGGRLLPEAITRKQLHSPLGNNDEEGICAAAFQLNFIRGGIIVAAAVHHVVSDGPGFDSFLTMWAAYSAAASKGAPLPSLKEPYSDGPGAQNSTLDPAKLKDSFPVVKNAGGPMPLPPADFKMPPLVSQMWHVPKSKAEKLKLAASSETGSGWISTYDAITALMWSSVTRAKLDLLQPSLDSSATLVHALDTRKVWDPALPDPFLGVATTPARCVPLPLKDLVDPKNLSKLAVAVRASISEVNSPHLTGLLQWISSQADRRWLEININSFLGMDFGATSWRDMTSYEKHDFGFGLPKALRWPSPTFEGFMFLYPSRAASKPADADEGVEICVCLEASCQARLMVDDVLLAYAEPRGV